MTPTSTSNTCGSRRNPSSIHFSIHFIFLAVQCLLLSCPIAGLACCRPSRMVGPRMPASDFLPPYRGRWRYSTPLAAVPGDGGDSATTDDESIIPPSSTASTAPVTTTTMAPSGDASHRQENAVRLLREGLRRTSLAVDASTSDQIFRSSSSLKKMRDGIFRNTSVGPSSLGADAGLGLFATKNIKAGTIVGLYPAHALGCEFEAESGGATSVFVTNDDGEGIADDEYFLEHYHGTSPYLHATDQPLFQRPSLISTLFENAAEEPPLYLDVNPNNNDGLDGAWTSHYINDGASLLDVVAEARSPTDADVEQYYVKSTRSKNCIHVPFGPSPVLATVTTKKVKKGQELFTSYGVVYWLGAVVSSAASAPAMTERIQGQILESARDLRSAMEGVKRTYAAEMQDLENAMRDI